jgi:hypothetical protein
MNKEEAIDAQMEHGAFDFLATTWHQVPCMLLGEGKREGNRILPGFI